MGMYRLMRITYHYANPLIKVNKTNPYNQPCRLPKSTLSRRDTPFVSSKKPRPSTKSTAQERGLVLSGLILRGTKRTKDVLYGSTLNLAELDSQTYSPAK